MIITAQDLAAHLNLGDTECDQLLERKIQAAQEWISKFTGIDFSTYYVEPPPPPPPPDPPDPLYEEPVFDSYATIPAPLREAVRQLAGHPYENREAALVGVSAQALPFGLIDLVTPYRSWAF